MSNRVAIVSACRTAVGVFGGSLKPIRAPYLMAAVMKDAVKRAKIDPNILGDVRFGTCMEDVDALNSARVGMLLAGLPIGVPAATMNRVCTSAMEATVSGAFSIQAGFHDAVLVGGCESMSNAPYVLPDARWGARLQDTKMVDAVIHGLHAGSHFVKYPKDGPVEMCRGKPYIMGMTAEFLALKYNITREDQDKVALRSHNNVERATKAGIFKDEICPIPIPQKKGDPIMFDKDEHFRPNLTMDALTKLPPAFIPKTGTVTAGNSSGINDGASAMVLMSEKKALALGIKPLAFISGIGMGGCEPEYMGVSPVPAVKDLNRRTGRSVKDWDRIELNEAFAAQYFACEKLLELPRELTNVNGSGIGMGHPVGSTGARLIVTLLYELIRSNKKRGMATLCGGGGVSIAVEIEKA